MADNKNKACFSAEVFGADMARALDAFAALEVCISADTLRGGAVAAESVPHKASIQKQFLHKL
jgi:hypothetical protein